MKKIYIKPVKGVVPDSFGLYMLDDGIINVANFTESTRYPYYGNMMGWKSSVERYTVKVASEEDINTSVPVFSINLDEKNQSIKEIFAENVAATLCPIFPTIIQPLESESKDNKVTAFDKNGKTRKRAL